MKKIKVLHVLGPLNRGGAELRTLEMIEKSNKDKFEFHICSLSDEKGDLEDKINEMGIHINRININHSFYKEFKKIIKKHEYDVVHAHNYFFSGIIMFVAKIQRVPVRITHIRTTSDRIKRTHMNRLKYGFLKLLIEKYSTNIIGVSQSALNSIWGEDWEKNQKIKRVYNGFDSKDFLTDKSREVILKELMIDNEKDVYLHVGNFTVAKNHLKLLAVFKEILKINPQAHLILVGSGSSKIKNKINMYVHSNDIMQNVTFTGTLSNVNNVIHAADIVLFPSLWEGLPGAIIEASILKRPVVASSIKPCLEVAQQFSNIHCLPLNKSNQYWAFESERVREKYKNKQIYIEKLKHTDFSIDKTISQIEEIWMNCKL